MISVWVLAAFAFGYVALLFAVAEWGERRRIYPTQARWRPHVYALALGVYCTTWTFYGAVGTAAREGWAYVPIYLGPMLVFLFALPFLERLVSVARARNITSISDLLSSRFGRSRPLAVLVSVIALTAAIPYLALQYKGVSSSIAVLTNAPAGATVPWYRDIALGVALTMALFAVLFGTRRVSAAEHHQGLMLAIAFESLVKVLAFVGVGVWAWLRLEPGAVHLPQAFPQGEGLQGVNFVTTTLLAACAAFCLPRQFQVGVVECVEPGDVRRARWTFPAYLMLFTLFVVPVVLLAQQTGSVSDSPDTLLLTLPLREGAPALALLAFLGGLSAATAMVIVASIALATMITNDLVLPALGRSRLVAVEDLGERVLWLRRAAIVCLALLAYAYYRQAGTPANLAQIGLLAFAAFAQFAPGILAGLYWRSATRDGVFWGLAAGFALWLYTLVLPAVAPASALVVQGPAGLGFLRPDALLGFGGAGPLAHGALWSLAVNVAVLVGLSLRRGTTLQERQFAKAFVEPTLRAALPGGASHARVGDLETLAARIVGPAAARRLLINWSTDHGQPVPRANDRADRSLLQHVERALAGSLGASSARMLLTHALRRRGLELDEVAELLDETSQELNFSRQLLQATMENVAQGISVVDADLHLLAWNRRYIDMFSYPDGFVYVGRPVAELMQFNAERGELGPGDPGEQVARRLEHLRAGTPYVYQRRRRDGRVYEIRGQPMPDRGYVTTYSDVTEYKLAEQALLEAKQDLEARVEERTRALQQALQAEAAAKQLAEEANVGKTRFVAAASHDLLQPLNAARLFASALEAQAGEDGELHEIATRIDSSLRAAEELLDGLLDIARLDSGALRPELSTFPIADLLADLERQYAPVAAARQLQLRVVSSEEWVSSDRVLLRRILQNYFANALRYTRRGGVIVTCRRRGKTLSLRVSDTGPGIAEHHLEAIYTEFTRLERQSPWGEKGLGLGLSICDRIARLLDHPLELKSRPGRGSTFGVRVPVGRPVVHAPAVARPAPGLARLEGLVALCVDNDPTILQAMEAVLQRWGVRVVPAATIAEARAAFAGGGIDAVLADYHLDGGEDGLTLIELLRHAAAQPVAAALITADHRAELTARARTLGCPVLRKPVQPAALRAFLGAVGAGRAASRARDALKLSRPASAAAIPAGYSAPSGGTRSTP
jgi:Na+/proline symporter/signal transduction histidine kinase/CheY-like chemotaxis protein